MLETYSIKNVLSFKSKAELKRIVNICAYTGTNLPIETRTIEHVKPKSKKGRTKITNMLVTAKKPNNDRGAKPFLEWVKENPSVIINLKNYLEKCKGIVIDGVDYVSSIIPTLERESEFTLKFAEVNVQKFNKKV